MNVLIRCNINLDLCINYWVYVSVNKCKINENFVSQAMDLVITFQVVMYDDFSIYA